MIIITQRCIKLLDLICQHTGPVTARWLAAAMDLSERTVRYDLALLSDWLSERGVSLRAVPKKGFVLEGDGLEKAQALLLEYRESQNAESRFFTADERVRMIVMDVLEERSTYSFDEASQLFGVSRTTFARDLERADTWFTSHSAHLLRKQKRGIHLDVDEAARRRLIVEFICENSDQKALLAYFITCDRVGQHSISLPSAYAYINRILTTADLARITKLAGEYLKSKNTAINDNTFIRTLYYLAVMVTRIRDGHCLDTLSEDYHSFFATQEYKELCTLLADAFPGVLTQAQLENEAAYLTASYFTAIHDGSRVVATPNSDTAREISAFLLRELQQQLQCTLTEDSELNNALKIHLQAAITRMQLNMPAQNPMLEETRRKFPEIFSACTQIAEQIRERYGVRFDDQEVGYITMYIAGSVQHSRAHPPSPAHIRATLICGYGVGTVTFLMNSLKQQFPRIVIVDKLSIFDLYDYDFSRTDLVFTTIDIPLPLPRPLLKVSPILTRLDVRRIDAFLRTRQGTVANTTQEFRVNGLLSIIRKYSDIRDADQLARELKQAVGPYEGLPRTFTELPSLLDVLPRKRVIAHIEADTWEEAVRKAAQPLLDDGSTTESYVEEILRIKEQYGQYSVLSGGICIPHASPSIFYKLAMSLATLKTPLELELDGQKIKLYTIMVLSLSDSMTQAKVLDEVFSLLDEFPDMGFEMQQATNSTELCRIFKNYYDRLF